MQANLLFLLLIFLIILSFNNVQSINCYNCTTCTTSSPGTILSGCTSCATTVFSTRTEKLCASLCIPGPYQGGYLYCCNTSNCNYDTPISCYNCSTCTSSSPGNLVAGCTSCATTVYSSYTEKLCASLCIPGPYQGGYLYCCNTHSCNYNIPISCYTCSNCPTPSCPTCSSPSPGSITYGCTACATTVYSSYTEKSCVSSCSPGSYQGGNRYCCTSSNCNSDTPTYLVSCYQCSSCPSSSLGSITYGCVSCSKIVYSSYTERSCLSSSCSSGSNQGGICCNTPLCNSGYRISIYKTALIGWPLFVIGLLIC